MTLLDEGWTAEQAKGLLDGFKLNGAIPESEAKYPPEAQGMAFLPRQGVDQDRGPTRIRGV